MDYHAWSKQHLKQIVLDAAGKNISVWCSEKNNRPLIVLVHGIGGNYAGLIPLARELIDEYRLAIIELPGHGGSDIVQLPDAKALQDWFKTALTLLVERVGPVGAICAHSFGCSAVVSQTILQDYKVILLTPVPVPSDVYARYAKMIMGSAHFWARIYNWRIFIYLRGKALIKVHTAEARRRVRWVGWQSKPTYDQTVFQARLVDMILDGSAYQHAHSGKVKLILCGIADTTARQRDSLDMEVVFGRSKTVFLRGGHLLPIESPERVASVILGAMVH